jgi:hypothetical protein
MPAIFPSHLQIPGKQMRMQILVYNGLPGICGWLFYLLIYTHCQKLMNLRNRVFRKSNWKKVPPKPPILPSTKLPAL